MRKAGRYTAALLLVLVGAAVIADQYMGSHWTALLIDWWPVLFVALGVEYILFNIKYGDSDKQLKLDISGVIVAVILSAVVIGSTQSASLFRNWSGNLNLGEAMLSFTQEGHKFEQGTTTITLANGVDKVTVRNPSGNVVLKQGSSDQMQIQSTVYVALDDEQEASEIASESRLEQRVQGNELTIISEGAEYGGSFWHQRKARTDLVISLPQQVKLDMDLETSNGKITADQLVFKQELKLKTTNGEIQVSSVEAAKIDLESTNARITASQTKGNMKLETTNGLLNVKNHQGDAELSSTNGSLELSHVSGSVAAETTNGNIQIIEAPHELKANTTNGSVDVTSLIVNGDWDIETTHGNIKLALPSNGNFTVKGEGQNGSIQSALPLQIGKKSIEGVIGTGKNKIQLETKGNISIQKAE
ncbi:DUF4097 family beta strand repeat-containing protein [Paenibacillus sp. UNC451MF]|uniref:DUF4097 family beta strand repeat-containing protein n=1 Tax=Paenibacillus sp. UNC451MF TaxID=1449063 RepID=UPI00048A7FC6|nr:DUF4097 family beta strand repeat-containing protein [Paenibacillus sp. UNC451MF]